MEGCALGANVCGFVSFACLHRYVFPINMFEDASGRKSALLIENRMIMLFPTPDVRASEACCALSNLKFCLCWEAPALFPRGQSAVVCNT